MNKQYNNNDQHDDDDHCNDDRFQFKCIAVFRKLDHIASGSISIKILNKRAKHNPNNDIQLALKVQKMHNTVSVTISVKWKNDS